MDEVLHRPVMLRECLDSLALRPGDRVADCTLGLGGHAEEMLRAVGPEGLLVGLDRDPEALVRAEARLRARAAEWGWSRCPVVTALADFRRLGEVLDRLAVGPLGGALFDLGVSSMQLDLPERGFSFRKEGPLDMRMGPDAPEPAAELLRRVSEAELADLLYRYGEERHARRLARAIVQARARAPLVTTADLERVVWAAYPARERHGRIHPATRTFQALRIAVNDELAAIEPALEAAAERLRPGGRVVVLSYHSLEDRIVKRTFEWLSGRCRCGPEAPECRCGARPLLRIVTRKPVEPTEEETAENPRARSARLRCAERREAVSAGAS